MIYSLTIGTIIYLYVSLAVQLAVVFEESSKYGHIDMKVKYDVGDLESNDNMYPAVVDAIIRDN